MRTADVRLAALLLALVLIGAAAGAAWLAARGREVERPTADTTPGTTTEIGPDTKADVQIEPKTGAESDTVNGSALFMRHCVRCHAVEDLRAPLAKADRASALRDLLEFLADHGDSDEKEDRALATYLLETER
jgi:mono/diheme cytochrome c family protein